MSISNSQAASLEELRQIALDHFWPHEQQVADFAKPDGFRVAVEGKGCWVTDSTGRKFFDANAGMWFQNVGYGRKEIADAVYEQLQRINYAPPPTASEPALRLAAKVASLSPDKKSRAFFVSGGSEAVESALKMAKAYHRLKGNPGRYKIISRRGSYHGATLATLSLGGRPDAGPQHYGPLMPGNVHVTQPYSYRCLYCSKLSECSLECAYDFERAIEHEGPETVAAVIGEPVSVTTAMVPHPQYWPTLREICDKHGVLLIVDEVITGFGRTGKMFASEHWNLQPDILTMAKGLSSGYLPIGAAVARKDIADAFVGEEGKTLRHLFTFGGHPAACAAALANIEIMERENLVDNSAQLGKYLFEQLQTLYEHPIVGEIRAGLGLIGAIELVKDRDTRERFSEEANLKEKLTEAFMERDMLVLHRGDLILLSPPLCITKDEVDLLVRNLNEVVEGLSKELA